MIKKRKSSDDRSKDVEMKITEILSEAADIVQELMMGLNETSVFPENCETSEYSVTNENGVLMIPTKFKVDGKKLFVEIHFGLTTV